MKRKIIFGIAVFFIILTASAGFSPAEGGAVQEAGEANINVGAFECENGLCTFSEGDTEIKIPLYMLGGVNDEGKAVLNKDNLGKFFDSIKPTDNGMTFEVNKKGAELTRFGRGEWTVVPAEDDSFNIYRGDASGSPRFSVTFAGGGNYVMDRRPGKKTQTQSIYSPTGEELYYCNPIIQLGTCDVLDTCSDSQKENCIPTDPKNPIIITGTEEEGVDVSLGERVEGFFLADRCIYRGSSLSYDADTGNCYGVGDFTTEGPTMVTIVDKEGNVKQVAFDGEEVKGEDADDLTNAEKNQVAYEASKEWAAVGIRSGRTFAAAVGNFMELGYTYGWWDYSSDFLWYENWFEDSVLLQVISDPARYICELETDYADFLDEGFLPTSSGTTGADIQAERLTFTTLNLTTGEENETFYRYKVFFNINGNNLFKTVRQDAQGNPKETRKSEATVFLMDGQDINITGRIKLCAGKDCDDDEYSSFGTSTIGHALVVKSKKMFKRACIKFHDTDDMDSYVKQYLSENNKKVCNDVEIATPPPINVPTLTVPSEEGEEEGGDGGTTSPAPSGEIEV